MADLFLAVLQMSISGTLIGVPALLAGAALKKIHAPYAAVFFLWFTVLLRLICPITFSSGLSPLNIPIIQSSLERFVNAADSVTGDFQVAVDVPGGVHDFDRVTAAGIEPVTTDLGFDAVYYREMPDGTILPAEISREKQLPFLAFVWLLGAAAMALYGAASYLLLLRRLRFAVKSGEGVWESDRILTPCVVGFFRPQVYLPFRLTQQQREHILRHEQEHIRHGDPWWDLLAYMVLCIHWFNPCCWMLLRDFHEELETAWHG